MTSNKSISPDEFFSARSSLDLAGEDPIVAEQVTLAPMGEEGSRSVSVSRQNKRDLKDKKIYVNLRTGLPVRPPTSFGLFKHALRRTMKDTKVGFAEFNKQAHERWTKMSDEEKNTYTMRAKVLSEQFKKIEVPYLRKRVRQLQMQLRECRRATAQLHRNFSR